MVLSFCEGNPVALTELSVALSFAQLAREKVLAVVNPQPTLKTSTVTQLWGFLLYPSLTEPSSIE
jgi:hypothetical protein